MALKIGKHNPRHLQNLGGATFSLPVRRRIAGIGDAAHPMHEVLQAPQSNNKTLCFGICPHGFHNPLFHAQNSNLFKGLSPVVSRMFKYLPALFNLSRFPKGCVPLFSKKGTAIVETLKIGEHKPIIKLFSGFDPSCFLPMAATKNETNLF